jgi:hypothetical protein
MSAENPRPFLVEGAEGPIVIPESRYFRNAKAHPEWLQRKRLSEYARMVYACLELATIAFSREKAMKGMNGEAPLTNADICRRTRLSKQRVRDALVELEDAGLAERCRIDPNKPLQNGNIVICAWAEPHAAKSDREKKGSRAPLRFPEWLPESWDEVKPLIRRFKIPLVLELPLDEAAARSYLDRVSGLARSYLDLEKELARELETVRAQPNSAPIKEKEKERNERTKDTPPAAPSPEPAEAVRSFVSPSPIRENLRIFLTEFPGRFGLLSLPDDTALDLIAGQIPNEAVLMRFQRMAGRQNPKPNGGGWRYFIPLAENCRKGWEADEAVWKKLNEENEAKRLRNEEWRSANPEPEFASDHIVEVSEMANPPVDAEREASRRETIARQNAEKAAEAEQNRIRWRAAHPQTVLAVPPDPSPSGGLSEAEERERSRRETAAAVRAARTKAAEENKIRLAPAKDKFLRIKQAEALLRQPARREAGSERNEEEEAKEQGG